MTMNRREFGFLVGGALTALAVSSNKLSWAQAAAAPAVSPAAAELYAKAFTLDANNAPPLEESGILTPADLAMSRNSGLNVTKITLGGISGFDEALGDIADLQRIIERYPDYFLQVRVPSDMDRAHAEKKLGLIFSFESAEMLQGKVERIELFRNLGVRVMQLSYNKQGEFGSGVLATGGLTDLGRKAIAKMNEIGVTLDLSHANEQTTEDALAATRKTPVITHAGCAAVFQHPRNKPDRLLRQIAERGGVVGIYMLPYLCAPSKQCDRDDYMAHMEHALKVCGEDHVGVGCDVGMPPFDNSEKAMEEYRKQVEARKKAGVSAPGEERPPYVVGLNDPRRMETIADQLLKRGYSSAAVEKVLGKNFYRAFSETWT